MSERYCVTGWGFTVHDHITGESWRYDCEHDARSACARLNREWEEEIQRRADLLFEEARQ